MSSYGGVGSTISGGIGGGALIPRPRRNSNVSLHRQMSVGSGLGMHDSTFFDRGRAGNIVKFRAKGAFRGGITLSDAVAGIKLSGGDYLRWHELNADARGKIFLKIRVS